MQKQASNAVFWLAHCVSLTCHASLKAEKSSLIVPLAAAERRHHYLSQAWCLVKEFVWFVGIDTSVKAIKS